MSGAAKSGRPPWALTVWVDDLAIYTEVPCKEGPPLIQRYPLHEGGLSRALAFLREFHLKHEPQGGTFAILNNANIDRGKAGIINATPSQRDAARSALKKAGIIK